MNNNVRLNNLNWLVFNLNVESKLRDSAVRRITKVALHVILFLSKTLNLIVGDHRWHSQAVGLEKINLYREHFKNNHALQEYESKIVELFNTLENPACTKEEFLDLIINSDHVRVKRVPGGPRLQFQVLANEYGSNSSLEGGNVKSSVGLLSQFCSQFHPDILQKLYGINQNFLDQINQMITLSWGNIWLLRRSISTAIEAGNSALIEGGWIGVPVSHAILYEVVPVDADTVNFRIYNLGDGVQVHNTQMEGAKEKYSPAVEWRGVRKGALLDSLTLETLIEMRNKRMIPHSDQLTNFSAADLYKGLFQLLVPTEVGDVAGVTIHKTAQHSGVCSWRSLEAFLSTRLPKERYKKLILDVKLSSLLHLVEGTTSWLDTTSPANLWGLVHKAKLKLARKVDEAFKKGYVTVDYVNQGNGLFKQVEGWLSAHEPIEPIQESSLFQKLAVRIVNGIVNLPLWIYDKISVLAQVSLEQVYRGAIAAIFQHDDYQVYGRISDCFITSPQTAIQQLTQAADRAAEIWNSGHGDTPLNLALYEYVLKLPFDIEYWREIAATQPGGLEAIARQLQRLGSISFKTTYLVGNLTSMHPQMIFVQTKLKRLFHLLGQIDNPAYSELLPHEVRSALIRSTNGELYLKEQRLPELTSNHFNTIFDLQTLNDRVPFSVTKSPLRKFLSIHDAALCERLNSQLGIQNASDEEKTLRYLMSDGLPGWLCGLRDASILEMWLTGKSTPQPPTLDRRTGLELRYEYSDRFGNPTMLIELAGVESNTVTHRTRESSWYTDIEGTDIREIFRWKFSNQLKEKYLLKKDSRVSKSLTDEEQIEILQLFSYAKNNPWKLLGYFRKNPSKLSDPAYQVLFKRIFFSSRNSELTNNDPDYRAKFKQISLSSTETSRFPEVLEEFMAKFLDSSFREGEISTCVFLNQLAGIFESYYPQSPVYSRTFERIAGLLHKPNLSSKNLKRVYLGLIEYVYRRDSLTDEQMFYALRGMTELAGEDDFLKTVDPEMVKCRNDFSYKHYAGICAFLGYPNALRQDRINELVSKWVPQPQVWRSRVGGGGLEVVNQDGTLVYNAVTGVIQGINKFQNVPMNIATHSQFVQIFLKKPKTANVEHDVCRFETTEGGIYYIVNQNGNLIVQKSLDAEGAYASYCSLPLVFSSATNGQQGMRVRGTTIHGKCFAADYQGWIESTSPHIIRFKEIGKPDAAYAPYQIDMRTGTLHDIINDRVLSKPSMPLSHFESPEFIHEWQSADARNAILEFPRYNLAFTKVSENPAVYESREFPGYVLRPEQRISALGIYKEYLVLENAEGKRKILLPHLKLMRDTIDSLKPSYAFSLEYMNDRSNTLRFLDFDIDDNGNPVANTLEGRLWLAQILTLVHKYPKAAKILRSQGEKVTPYTKNESDVLDRIIALNDFNGDNSGDGIGIRLYAVYLKIKNKQITNSLEKEDLSELASHYLAYLSHLNNVKALPLKPHEERFLCTLLMDTQQEVHYHNNPIIVARNQMLCGIVNVPSAPNSKTRELVSSSVEAPQRESFDSYAQMERSARESYLITRAEGHILTHFAYFQALAARGGGAEKERLRAACKFMMANHSYRLMAQWLLHLMVHPELYSPPEDWKLDTWLNTKKRAKELQDQIALVECNENHVNTPHEAVAPRSEMPVYEKIPFSFTAPDTSSYRIDPKGYFKKVPTGTSNGGILSGFKSWLSGLKGEQPNLSPLENREYNRLIDDCDAVQEKKQYQTTPEALTALEATLNDNREQNRERIAQLKSSILKKARRRSNDSDVTTLQKIREKGGDKKIDFEDVLISFARKNPDALKEMNSCLTGELLHEIYTETAEYLQLVTWEQQRGRGLTELKKARRATGPKQEALIQSLRTIIASERAYTIQDNPALLVFEYYSQKLLWEKQVRGLQLFLDRKDENPIMELIMGSGKSEVLLPLLALLRADGECISMIIAPETLFENISSNAQKTNREAFGQALHTIHFERNTQLTEAKLKLILDELIHIRDHKEALVVTSKTIQCIILKFVELASKHYGGEVTEAQPPNTLILLGQILQLLSTSGLPIVDEADSIMRIMHEVSFNLGERIQPNQHEIEFIRTIYQLIHEHPALKQQADQALTSQHYEERWKPVILREMIRSFQTAKTGFCTLDQNEARCLNQLSEKDLTDYLCRNPDRALELDAWFDAIPHKKVRDLVSLAAEEVSHLLSYTLLKEWNVAYGLDSKSKSPIPVPFEFAAVPKSGSVFANSYITKNYAFQTFLTQGVDEAMLEAQIKRLQDQAADEMRLLGTTDYTLTKAWSEFCILKGPVDIPFLKLKKKTHIRFLVQEINRSRSHLLTYVSHFVLPQLVLFNRKLTCSPINMISLFRWFSGFTGTLWNGKSMYHMATPIAEKGTDAKTIGILWKNSNSPEDILIVENKGSQNLLEELQHYPHEVLIDGGGYLKEMTNKAVAERMTELSNAPTVYYNTKGEKTVLVDGKEVPLSESDLSPNQRRTYYDHSHTIGANVTQKMESIALVTIPKKLLLRDMLQFVWRMRGLDQLQRIKFVVSREVAELIRMALSLPSNTPIRFVHILAYAIKNQAEQQGMDNHKAFVGQLWNVPQQLLLRVLFSQILTEDQKKLAFDELEKVWVKAVATSASECFGKVPREIEASEDVAIMLNKATRFLVEAYEKCPFLEWIRPRQNCLNDFEKIKEQILDKPTAPVASSSTSQVPDRYLLPPKASSPEHPHDETVDIELDLDTDTQRELELVQVEQNDNMINLGSTEGVILKKVESFAAIDLNKHKYNNFVVPLSLILEEKGFHEFGKMFEGIDFTVNMLQWEEQAKTLDQFGLFGLQKTPLTHILFEFTDVTFDMRKKTTLVLSEADLGTRNDYYHNYYDVNFGFRIKNRKLTAAEIFDCVRIKFFFGEICYSEEEQQVLEQWIAENGPELLRGFFEQHVLLGFPIKAEKYRGSWLYKKLRGQ